MIPFGFAKPKWFNFFKPRSKISVFIFVMHLKIVNFRNGISIVKEYLTIAADGKDYRTIKMHWAIHGYTATEII